MNQNNSTLTDLIVSYGVAVVSIIIALVFGAYAFAAAITLFFDSGASLPGVFGLIGGGGNTDLIVSGVIALVAGVISHFSLKKITSSPEAGNLVSSDNYQLINRAARSFCNVAAAISAAGAVAVLLTALLSITDYTPWKTYMLGEFMPLLFIAVGFYAAGMMVDRFVKATMKPSMLSAIAMGVAALGLVLAIIAVLIDVHGDSSSSTVDTSDYVKTYEPVKLDLDYSDFDYDYDY